MRSNLKLGALKAVAAFMGLTAALIQPIPVALAQQPALGDHAARHDDQMPDLMQQHHQQMGSPVPTMPGQAAFGAIQEIVRLLEADPNTDWSTVDLEALRQHLIDMNEATLKANASANPVDGGLEIAVTGDGRTLAAIQRMVPAHAQELNRMNGWSAKTELLPNGVLLTVTASDPKEIQHIQGLGFIGLLVSGSHHQPHHLGMAKGEFQHHH
jgi:hypothetical protein